MASSVSVAVVGATGFGGSELVFLLDRHPTFSPDYLTSQSFSGEPLSSLYPRFKGQIDQVCERLDPQRLSEHELVFFALPHGKSMEIVPELDLDETRVVDLAADYRLRSRETFEDVYEEEHLDPGGLDEAVFGLTEYHQESISEANLVACPGCYVTASLLPLYPIAREGPELESFFIDAKSGISGAGRKPSSANTFLNCNDNIKPYSVASHRHSTEIGQQLRDLGSSAEFSFVPHVNAMDHGIEAAIYLDFEGTGDPEEIQELIRETCDENQFLRYFDRPPGVKSVVKTPYCDISVIPDGSRAIVFSNLDNLWKGAASQAVQNANLMFDHPMSEGLL